MKIVYPAPHMVSIWVGTFKADFEFDDHIEQEIVPRLGLPVPIAKICEIGFSHPAQSVEELLQGFSGCNSFIHAAAKVASALDIKTVNSALVCYYLQCTEAPTQWGRMAFLGSFNGHDVT